MDDLKAIKEKARKWDYFTNPHGNYTDKISTLKARIATLVEENERYFINCNFGNLKRCQRYC